MPSGSYCGGQRSLVRIQLWIEITAQDNLQDARILHAAIGQQSCRVAEHPPMRPLASGNNSTRAIKKSLQFIVASSRD